jgi:hypothetical protein
VKRETALGLYKGLGAVMTGIIPKMAIRFTSYEWYKQMLADKDGHVASKSTFMGTFKHFPHLAACWESLTPPSRTRRRRHRSNIHSNAHGSHKNPPPSPTPLARRPPRRAQIPKRNARHVHRYQRRRRNDIMARCLAHRAAPGDEPSGELYGVFGTEGSPAGVSWADGFARVGDGGDWVCERCCGTVYQCAD